MNDLPSSGWLADLAAFADIRLIAIDVDGTLADAPHSDLAYQIGKLAAALNRTRSRVSITLATGRALSGVSRFMHALRPVKLAPLILYNGGVIYDAERGKVLSVTTISQEASEAVLRAAESAGCTALFYCIGQNELQNDGSGSVLGERVLGFAKQPPLLEAIEFNGMSIAWLAAGTSAPSGAVAILIPRDGAQGLNHDALRSRDDLKLTTSGSSYTEITSAGVDKGRALAILARHLELSPHEVAAIGDNDNDVEMLDWAGLGVAVSNASKSALGASSYVTQFPAAKGVVEYLRLVQDAHRYLGRS